METGINAVILIAGSVGMFMGAYALNRSRRGRPAEAQPPRSGQEPTDELELLRYENAMLRAEQQRALSLGKAGERAREQLANVATSPGIHQGGAQGAIRGGIGAGTDEGDDAWSALTEATVLRETMLAVCQDLQNAMRHVQVQLSSGVPITELDRRKSDREPHPAAGDGDFTVAHLPDRARADLSVVQETGS